MKRLNRSSSALLRPRLVVENLEDRCLLSTWSEPINLGAVINTEYNDQHPGISGNGLSLYFSSTRPGGFGDLDLWVSQRASLDDPWGPPVNLGPTINTEGEDHAATFSRDGHWLFFHSNGREDRYGGTDIYVAYREDPSDDFGWQPPVNLGPGVNSQYEEGGATYFEDQETGINTFYFASNRPGGFGDFDIYASVQDEDGLLGKAVHVPELNTPQRDTRTAIRRDGLEILITSNRPGGLGMLDIWVATRKTTLDPWSVPVNLGAPVNTPTADGAPALSADGNTMFFYSDRPGGVVSFDLYMSRRQVPQWSKPINLGAVINTEYNDQHPAISGNGLSLYFSSTRPGWFGDLDLWVSQRASLDDPWGPPVNLGPTINTEGEDHAATFSRDGHWLFFHSNGREDRYGGTDIYVAYREDPSDDFGWQPPVNLGPGVNSEYDEGGATYFEDEETGINTFYFASNRLGGFGDFDIYASVQDEDGLLGKAVHVPELNTLQRDTRTAIRRDGLEILITSNRPGGRGGLDIWVATRKSTLDPWSTPVNLGDPVNTSSADGAPALSADGNTMFFYSDRPGGVGSFDLYVTTREERGGSPGPSGDLPAALKDSSRMVLLAQPPARGAIREEKTPPGAFDPGAPQADLGTRSAGQFDVVAGSSPPWAARELVFAEWTDSVLFDRLSGNEFFSVP